MIRYFKHFALTVVIIGGAISFQFHQPGIASALSNHAPRLLRLDDTKDGREKTYLLPGLTTQRYRLDASQSKFIARVWDASASRPRLRKTRKGAELVMSPQRTCAEFG